MSTVKCEKSNILRTKNAEFFSLISLMLLIFLGQINSNTNKVSVYRCVIMNHDQAWPMRKHIRFI